jgi:hypothetical protein
MKYHIPAGTKMSRVSGDMNAGGEVESFVSDRAVTFKQSEMVELTGLGTYVFRLPSSAAPWNRLLVDCQEVKFVVGQGDVR